MSGISALYWRTVLIADCSNNERRNSSFIVAPLVNEITSRWGF